mgnify:CR=1 FL=1
MHRLSRKRGYWSDASHGKRSAQVVGLGILADYHAGVDTFTRSDKERTALLGIESDRKSMLLRFQRR